MRKGKKILAGFLLGAIVLTSAFPGTAYAAEVGEQVGETADQITVLNENSDLIEQAVIEAIQARGGDINDQALVDQVREEVRKKIENGELKLDEKTEEETTETTDDSSVATTEDANTSSESVTVTDHTSADEVLSDGDNSSKVAATRLIVTSDVELTEFYGAVTVDHYDNIYVLAYKSVEETDSAFNSFVANGITVEKDASMDAIKEDEVPEDKVAKEVTDTEVTDVKEDTPVDAQPVAETVGEHKTVVAVIDTGISDVTNDDTFKDRIIEGTSTISDSYVDDNGHGTAMAKIIAEDTADENVMLLPIKALDKDGKGTVLSVALAIKYAKEHGADVINLSLSGVGQSNILTNAINACYNSGITVVTAAGNDNADAKEYIPGNVDTAINIAAAEEDADGKIVSASYTNHGDNIDFAALGTYKLVVEKEKTTLETELRGTSIASAHVAAYVALLKQINSTAGGVVNPVSESDVMESLIASADDFEGTINHTYFGKGYLSKEGLIFKKSDKEDEKKDTDKEEKEADADQGMISSGGTWEVLCNNSGWGQFNAWWNNSSSCAQAVYDTVNTAYNYYRFDTLILHIQDACVFDTQIMVPAGKTLIIYGGNSIWTGDANKRIDWSKVGNGANSDGIKGTCIGAENNATLEVHNVNFYDWTTTTANFDEAPGCIGTYDDARNTYATLKADRCNFFSQNHWWSVSAGKAGSWVTNCYFNNNASARSHGALCIVGGADVTDCTFDGKKGCSNSRALTIANNGGTTRITNCSIKNYGGWNPAVEADGTVIIQSCVINNGSNKVGDADIAISHSNGTLNMANSEICGAKVSGIKTASNSAVNISNCNIYSNAYGISNNGTINIRSDYDQSQYYNRYADLRNTFGNDGAKLWNHWINDGMSEGRVASNNCSTKIHNNSSYGIFNSGTVNMPGGSIYSNSYGIYSNNGTVNIGGGTIYNNNNQYPANIEWAKGAGVMNDGDNATTNISGGTIRDNGWGNVWNNNGTLNVTGGTISQTDGQNQTTSFGIWNNTTANISGSADIYGYTTISNGNVAAAIRNCNTLTVKSANNKSPSIHGSTFGIDTSSGTTTFEDGAVYENNTGFYCNTGATVNFKKGTVKDNTSYGLNNSGTTNMTGGTFTENNIGINNSAGTTSISDGAITKSKQMNVDVYDGTVNFNGGSITESGTGYYGVENENRGAATFNQSANIGTNYFGGVRNKAIGINRYNIYKGATTAVGSNGKDIGVYLDPGASMTIHSNLTSDVKVASYDRYTGKVIANCDNEAIANSAAQHLMLTGNKSFQKTTLNTRKYADTYADLLNAYGYNYEALWNHYNAYGRNEGRAAGDCGKTVVYRKGNKNTGAKTQIIVSQTEDTSFDTNLEANKLTDSRFSARIRTSDEFTGHKNAQWRDYVTTYWGEYNSPRAESIVYLDGKDVSKSIYNSGWATSRNGQKEYGRILTTYAGWYPTTLYAKYETGYDPNANHNDIDKPEKDDGKDDILDPNPQAPEKKPGENPNPQGYSYFFNGNNQDTGENYTVRHISSSYQMPDTSDFTRDHYTGQGWSIIADATYKNTEEPTKMRKQGETADTLALLNACLKRNDCEVSIDNNGNITITQYVVWDRIPTITAKDVTIAQHQVKTMDDNTIKSMLFGNCIAKDEEDGDKSNNNKIPNNVKDGEIGVTIIDFDRDELLSFKSTGSTTITFRATDGVGNTADKTVRLWVMSEDPIDGAYINRARCINKKFYDAGKGYEEGDLTGYKQGGLMPTDLWYTDDDYVKVIEDAFSNLANENWEFTWRFTHEQVLETQDYIEEHGFGDSIEKGALMNYYNKYKGNIGTNKLPNICDRTKHEVIPATCTEAAHCSICGETWGKPEHNYKKEIGSNVEVCTNCGATK